MLEFYVTATYNTPLATVSAFLLSNGRAYNLAHTAALIETTLLSLFAPRFQSAAGTATVVGGLILIVMGQTTRSLAMAHAGTNFNHQVQYKRSQGHQLVTTGIYSLLRHPAYFGFFWWAVGTQVLLGNAVCLAVYAIILWRFFNARIRKEEQYLVSFFGEDYVRYRKRVRVGIPFIP